MRSAVYRVVRSTRAAWKPTTPPQRCVSSLPNTVQEGDYVLLHKSKNGKLRESKLLSRPLRQDGTIRSQRGNVRHADIIGKAFGERVNSNRQEVQFLVRQPTLDEYAVLTPRHVTPIYPPCANIIVSMLDIHVDTRDSPASSQHPGVEILEAGTGHGALTLYLARAIHGTNTALTALSSDDSDLPERGRELSEHKAQRAAVIHTLEIEDKYSEHAKKIVHGFRRGLYAGDVDFHVGDLSDFLEEQWKEQPERKQRFSHIILDLPATHKHLPKAVEALRDQGVLLVFCPQITQIANCVEQIQRHSLPLVCEQVVEIVSGQAGGRPWTVEMKQTRKSLCKGAVDETVEEVEAARSKSLTLNFLTRQLKAGKSMLGMESSQTATADAPPSTEDEFVWVCKPSVGIMTVNGGFVALWRRTSDYKRDYVENGETSMEGISA